MSSHGSLLRCSDGKNLVVHICVFLQVVARSSGPDMNLGSRFFDFQQLCDVRSRSKSGSKLTKRSNCLEDRPTGHSLAGFDSK